MRCRLCDRRMRPGQRVTVASIVERSGELSPVMTLHESCMGEVVRAAPELLLVPHVDVDEMLREVS